MREAGFDTRVIPANIDETALPDEGPFDLVERLARAKAAAVAKEHAEEGEPVVAADTIVALNGELLGKPADEPDARRMLHALSGKTHQVATGVCIVRDGNAESFVDITDVTFYELSHDEIDAYVTTGEPMDKAGAYGIQGQHGRMLVEKIDGDFYNVVGLPIARRAHWALRLVRNSRRVLYARRRALRQHHVS